MVEAASFFSSLSLSLPPSFFLLMVCLSSDQCFYSLSLVSSSCDICLCVTLLLRVSASFSHTYSQTRKHSHTHTHTRIHYLPLFLPLLPPVSSCNRSTWIVSLHVISSSSRFLYTSLCARDLFAVSLKVHVKEKETKKKKKEKQKKKHPQFASFEDRLQEKCTRTYTLLFFCFFFFFFSSPLHVESPIDEE